MRHRAVRELMTQEVVTAVPGTPLKDVAALFERNDVTAVPVVDAQGRPLGVVSEGDLVRKAALLGERTPAAALGDRDRARVTAETAGELMTAPAIMADADWAVAKAARMLVLYGVKRLPVVDDAGRLVGILSRRDIAETFLRNDGAIRAEIAHDVLGETLWLTEDAVQVHVRDGVVTLTGRVPLRSLLPVVDRLCRGVDGVVAVHTDLDWDEDDTPQGRTAEP